MPPSLSLSTRSKILTPTSSPASSKGIYLSVSPPSLSLSALLLLTCVRTIKFLTKVVNTHKLGGTQVLGFDRDVSCGPGGCCPRCGSWLFVGVDACVRPVPVITGFHFGIRFGMTLY
jgi:hypothetical protein